MKANGRALHHLYSAYQRFFGVFVHLVLGVSGIAMGMAFPPFDLWPLAWFALVPPLLLATAEHPRWLLTGGTVFGAAWAAVMLDWLVNILGYHAIGIWILVGICCALPLALIAWMRRVWGVTVAVWLAPFLWVGLEFYRSEIWALKFPWLALAYSQHNNLRFLQWASVVGPFGLSLVMAVFAAALTLAIRGKSLIPLITVSSVVLAMHFFAIGPAPVPSSGTIKIAGVQVESPSMADLRDGLERLVREHPDAAVLVLPEYCLDLTRSPEGLDVLREFAQGRWVIVGAKQPAPDANFYNVVLALAPGGDLVFQQRKSVPVPLLIDGLPAETRVPLELPQGRIGVGLCYDQDFTFIAADLVAQGAELLLYPTGDLSSWGAKQRVQHATLATMRAIENRRWVMRVASSGVSRVVDPYGNVVAEQGIDAPGGLIGARVAMRSDLTLFARFGWVVPHLCLGGTILILTALLLSTLLLTPFYRYWRSPQRLDGRKG